MELFSIDDFEVKFKPQTLLLKPFKVIWDRDTNIDKRQALKDLAFVYFYADYKSDYADVIDDDDREIDLKKSLAYPKDWFLKDDKDMEEAIKFYRKRSVTTASTLLVETRKSIYKLSTHISSLDFTEKDEKGKLVHNPKSLSDIVATFPKLLGSLNELEAQFLRELKDSSTMRGNQIKNTFEDGL